MDWKAKWESNKDQVAELHKQNPLKRMLRHTKSRSKRLGLSFNLTLAELNAQFESTNRCCPIRGIPYEVTRKRGGGPNSPTLDRVDNSKGYVSGNVVIMSQAANVAKGNRTPIELLKIATSLALLERNMQYTTKEGRRDE